ncbi:DUF2853 family protein [Denitromonas iodatirespirans]|uniref:DUF2853 family protein n=1 Tax=Denitromonas iodatirespirans TaxID=2795389 RepID=A0A944DC32_DENI1|nr:DUF2853 family protein [Denitromonas iodatirespirans]MBT0963500.1 DUF2853 family protein [Denitromonas iodatirespirans]
MSDYLADVQKFAPKADAAVVDSIVKYCGIALRNKDSSLVSASDKAELDRVRDGFAKKKLELDAAAAEAGIAKVCDTMKGVNQKSRVTFYYLLAEATGTLGKLA